VAVASAGPFAPYSRQITTPAPHHSIFTGQMLFLMSNQQCQSTEGQKEPSCYRSNVTHLFQSTEVNTNPWPESGLTGLLLSRLLTEGCCCLHGGSSRPIPV